MNLDTIIVAILSLIGTSVGTFSGFKLTTYRVEQLEKKVDKHNSFAERIPVLENRIQNVEHQLEIVHHEE